MGKGGLQVCFCRWNVILGEFIFQCTYLHEDSARDMEIKEWRKV